jgi:tetratricopeptide (TPR) repeat protein
MIDVVLSHRFAPARLTVPLLEEFPRQSLPQGKDADRMDSPRARWALQTSGTRWARAALLGVATVLLVGPAWGQTTLQSRAKQAPNDLHFGALGAYHQGEYRNALQGFVDAGKSGIVSTEGRWIDSICYYAMIGECYYQTGENQKALDQFNAALKLFLSHRDWMLRVEFPDTISPKSGDNTTITWGSTSRATTLGQFQARYQTLQGRLDNAEVIRQGGIVAPPELRPVYVSEIVRCTALALSRRRELMGPVCEHDQLTAMLVDALARRPGKPNHWSQCWVELQLGLAYASANKVPQAVSELTKSLLAQGAYDHPLTCVALVELGKLAAAQGKYDAAIKYYHEATISAAYFDRADIMEEGFRLGTEAFLASGGKGVYPPLVPAALWARKLPMLQTSILTALADNLITVGDVPKAIGFLGDANAAMRRTGLPNSVHGARWSFQSARASLQSGKIPQAGTALQTALGFQKTSSKRLFQISLIDAHYRSGGVTERVADLLFTEALRDPTRVDWLTDPLETLGVLTNPHLLAYEHWFELTLKRKDQDRALEIADRIRRQRFYSTQTLGGRVLALRWVLAAPVEALSPEAQLQRQDLLVRYPAYAELAARSANVTKQLAAMPLDPAEEPAQKEQLQLLAELAQTSAAQEAFLSQLALERVPAELAFPPALNLKAFQQDMRPGTLAIVYLVTSNHVHGFALAKERYAHFIVAQPASLKADTGELLRGIGQIDRTQPVAGEELLKTEWKTTGARLLKQLTNNATAEDWAKYDELIVVPDGILWYLPFEMLEVATPEESKSLFSLLQVRYAPTLALAAADRRPARRVAKTAMIAGQLMPREDPALTELSAEQLGSLEGAAVFRQSLPGPSGVFGAMCDRALVMADLEDADRLPYGWAPFRLDAGKPGSTLADWVLLPFDAPQHVILPGFHTPAEHGLRKPGNGDEVFLTVMGLMASGCRTVLLSRWRVGGQNTVELMREFVRELPHSSAAAAWRRSVQLAADRVLDPAAEPRLKLSVAADGLTGDHPFFWAGYLLVDGGAEPTPEAPIPAEPGVAAPAAPAEPAAEKVPAAEDAAEP